MTGNVKVLVLGHRGYRSKYLENTIESIIGALKAGADGVEVDVRLTRDGVPIVYHDPSLRRLAGVKKRVKELTVSDVKNLKVRKSAPIPTLAEVLDVIVKYSSRRPLIDLEVKDYKASGRLLKLVEERCLLDTTIFTSSDPRALIQLRMHSRGAKLGYIVRRPSTMFNPFILHEKVGLEVASVSVSLKRSLGVEMLRRYLRSLKLVGLKVALWTLNDPRDLDLFQGLYDIVITDDVEKILKSLRRSQRND